MLRHIVKKRFWKRNLMTDLLKGIISKGVLIISMFYIEQSHNIVNFRVGTRIFFLKVQQ